MNWIQLLELGISTLLNLLAQLKPGTTFADAKVASEIQAALDRLQAAKDLAVTQPELESLRTTPLW